MKFRVKSLDEVDEKYRDLYEKDGDTYVLKVEDDPSEGMRKARDHEKEARKKAEQELRELREQQERDQEDKNRKNGDVEKVEKAWKDKYEKLEQTMTEQLSARDSQLQTMLVDNVASQLATELFTSAALGLPHVKSRLGVESVDGKFVTRVKDPKTGEFNPALTLDDFKKEISENPDFAPIRKSSNAKGGNGAPPPSKFNQQQNDNPTNLGKATPAELVAHIKSKE